MVIIQIFLEANPFFFVCYCIIRGAPYREDVIDVSFLEKDVGFVVRKDVVLVDGEVEVGVYWCWWGSHGCASFLNPERVAELEHVVPHDDGEGFDEGIGWD